MAINDVLPLNAARRDSPLLTLKRFWDPGTPATQFRWFHLHSLRGATLFGSHQRHLPPPVWQSLVGFCLFVGCRVQRLATKQNTEFTDGE